MDKKDTVQKTQIRVAIFGVGGMGVSHLQCLLDLPGVEIVAICDRDQPALDAALLKIKKPVPVSLDGPAFAATVDCDYAVVIVPNPARLPIVERLLARKIPLFMEKPAAHSLKDFEKILRWRRASGVPVMVGQNYRFDPAPRAIRKLIASGEIGEVLGVHGRFQRSHFIAETAYYGKLPDVLPFRVEMVIHHMDLVAYWVGSAPARVAADGFRTAISWGVGQMGCDILARFENGTRLNYHGDWSIATNLTSFNGHWIICGSKGTIRWEDGPIILKRRPAARHDGENGEEIRITPATKGPSSLNTEHQEFIAALQEGRMPESEIEENVRSMRLCLQAAEQNCLA